MRSILFALAAAAGLAVPLAAAPPSVGDFRLPPAAGSQTSAPERQGPVAPDVPESRRPAPTPTPTPSRTATPAPAPVIAVPPIALPPSADTTPPVAEPRAAPRQAPANQPSPPPVAAASEPGEPASTNAAGSASPAPSPTSAPTSPPTRVAAEGQGSSLWVWVLGALLALAGAGFAAWARMRRPGAPHRAPVPEIERPRVPAHRPPADASSASEPLAPPPPASEPLHVTLEPLRFSLTLMNAVLAWRLEVANRGNQPLTGLSLGADMISAHASISREEQLSGPAKQPGPAAMPVHRIERLEPGESRSVEGEFRLPLGLIVPIRQGNAALLLPLARFRVEGDGVQPLVRTFAIGQPGNGSTLQPFRLDLGPRVYPQLAQRAFA